jgi:hypothetical protein
MPRPSPLAERADAAASAAAKILTRTGRGNARQDSRTPNMERILHDVWGAEVTLVEAELSLADANQALARAARRRLPEPDRAADGDQRRVCARKSYHSNSVMALVSEPSPPPLPPRRYSNTQVAISRSFA